MLRTYSNDAAVAGEAGVKPLFSKANLATAVQNKRHDATRIRQGFPASAEVVLDNQPKLTDANVTAIRTAGLTDNSWARKLRTTNGTIRSARIGKTYRHVPTPPDTAPREGGMPYWQIKAKPARVRRSYFDDLPTHRGITP